MKFDPQPGKVARFAQLAGRPPSKIFHNFSNGVLNLVYLVLKRNTLLSKTRSPTINHPPGLVFRLDWSASIKEDHSNPSPSLSLLKQKAKAAPARRLRVLRKGSLASKGLTKRAYGDPGGCRPCPWMPVLSFSCSPLPGAQRPLPPPPRKPPKSEEHARVNNNNKL
eukprot:1154358-Pelagomonas_calceolata.AAC.18